MTASCVSPSSPWATTPPTSSTPSNPGCPPSSADHTAVSYTRGTNDQIWIAGGIGITPFLSWLHALEQHPVRGRVALYYVNSGPAPFAEEIAAIVANHDNIRLHVVDSSAQGHLTPYQVLVDTAADTAADTGTDPGRLSVFLCGPRGMVHTFTRALRRAGVAPRNLHREHFDWR
jgi:predicted ferric reductase